MKLMPDYTVKTIGLVIILYYFKLHVCVYICSVHMCAVISIAPRCMTYRAAVTDGCELPELGIEFWSSVSSMYS